MWARWVQTTQALKKKRHAEEFQAMLGAVIQLRQATTAGPQSCTPAQPIVVQAVRRPSY